MALVKVGDDILVGLGRVVAMRRCCDKVTVYNDEGSAVFYGRMYPSEFIVMPSEFTQLLQDATHSLFHWAFRRSAITGVQFTGDTANVSLAGAAANLAKDVVVTDPLIRTMFQ